MTFVAGDDDEGVIDLFLECIVDHLEGVVSVHRSLVNDDGIVLPDHIVDHILLICRNRDVKKGMDSVDLQMRVEFLPIVGGKKTQGTADCDRILLFD